MDSYASCSDVAQSFVVEAFGTSSKQLSCRLILSSIDGSFAMGSRRTKLAEENSGACHSFVMVGSGLDVRTPWRFIIDKD
jgi:hypothetical protein